MQYGKAIRLVRVARGLSQRELAKRLSVDPSAISLMEADKRTPSSEVLQALSSKLGVPEYLLVFLATGAEGLRGVSEERASQFGRELLQLVMEEFPDSAEE